MILPIAGGSRFLSPHHQNEPKNGTTDPAADERPSQDSLHLVHSPCQADAPWLTTWCQIAVEPSGQRAVDDTSAEDRERKSLLIRGFCGADYGT